MFQGPTGWSPWWHHQEYISENTRDTIVYTVTSGVRKVNIYPQLGLLEPLQTSRCAPMELPGGEDGPATRPVANSTERYSLTIWGCCCALSKFFLCWLVILVILGIQYESLGIIPAKWTVPKICFCGLPTSYTVQMQIKVCSPQDLWWLLDYILIPQFRGRSFVDTTEYNEYGANYT